MRTSKAEWLAAVHKAATLSRNHKHRRVSRAYLQRVVATCPYPHVVGARIILDEFSDPQLSLIPFRYADGREELRIACSPFDEDRP